MFDIMMKGPVTRFVSLFAILTLLALPAGGVGDADDPGGSFVDDDNTVHEGAVEAIALEGITRGCNPPGNYWFCPQDSVTRGQMAAFLTRAFNLPSATQDHFGDDDGVVFEADINAVAEAEITRGCNPPANTDFCPDEPVTRGQMAAFLVRAFGYTDDGGGDLFTDDDGSVFEADIDRLAVAGVTQGCNPPDNDQYCPNDPVTRGQMGSFLARALELAQDPPPDPVLVAVLSITDGDTIRVNYQGSSTPLRFIGIDTPERGEVCFDEATDAMADLVSGETVRIDVDVSERDQFDRLLRYVFLTDGTFVNEEMVRLGWAEAADFPPDSQFASLFASVETEARAADRGKWDTSNCAGGEPEPPPPPPPDNCDPSYPTVCIPPPPPDLDCGDISHRNFTVREPDPHRFDGDNDGVGCET